MVSESILNCLSKAVIAYYVNDRRETSNLDLINKVLKIFTNIGGIFDKRQLIPGETREIVSLKQIFINLGKKF